MVAKNYKKEYVGVTPVEEGEMHPIKILLSSIGGHFHQHTKFNKQKWYQNYLTIKFKLNKKPNKQKL